EMEELNASCIMMARIKTVANDSDAEPSYDSDFVNETVANDSDAEPSYDSDFVNEDLLLTVSRVKGDGVNTTYDIVTMMDKEKPLEDSAG
ncbi:hypothetical protein Tco_1139385, partial [Tanacetum coccineum]